MKTLRLVGLLALAVPAGCGDDGSPASPDVADATDTAPDVADTDGDVADVADVADDTGVDATPDADAADGSGDTTPDVVVAPPLLTLEEAMASVDPRVGSGGVGFAYASGTPAAQMPVGFVKVGPDTTNRGSHAPQNHFSGFHDDDPDYRGFSHVRLVGTGAADLGSLRFLPLADEDERAPSTRFTARDPALEQATPGRFHTVLVDEGVAATMSAGYQSAIHRYEYNGGALLQIDAASSITDTPPVDASITVDGASVTGFVTFTGGFVGRSRAYTIYFDILLDTAPTSVGVWDAEGERDGTSATGTAAGAILHFDAGGTVEARVGLSLIDAAAATANRLAETDGVSLEELTDAAETAWEGVIDNVRVAGGTEREQRIFYSALYNAYRMPSRYSESDGRYRGIDGEVAEVTEGAYYSDLSMWDTYRTLHPWYSLTDPELQRDCVRSLLTMGEVGERGVPRWPAMLSYTGSMIGSSADIVIGDAAAKGIEGIDWEEAFELLYASTHGATFDPPLATGREGIASYLDLGYLPADAHGGSVSKTVEYAWDDFGLASVARAAGEDEMADALLAQSESFVNLFDARGFAMPRNADGSFVPGIGPRDVYMSDGPFTEGSAWHWRWYGLHAPDALSDALEAAGLDLGTELEAFFSQSRLGSPGPVLITIPDPFYWHGNEPSLHAAALFHAAGLPDRASFWTREIQDRLYDDTPAGLPGNDDGGTLSAWYLFTAIGLYPVAGSDLYYLNAPVFEEAQVDLGGGETLTVLAPLASSERRYVRSVTLDGEPITDGSVRHSELAGAVLRFELSDTPSEGGGSQGGGE